MSYSKVFNAVGKSHEEWLAFRRTGIGGSDMSAIMDMNPYRDAVAVWMDKTGRTEPDTEGNQYTYWGTKLEALVADEFAKETGWKVRNNNFTLQFDEHPWMLANIDREIVGIDAGLECKTASAYKKEEWEGDNVPNEYYIQCQHYMAVTGKSSWWIACLLGGNTFIYKEIPRNEEVIEAIIAQGEYFWNEFVVKDVMPATNGSQACTDALKAMYQPKDDTLIELPSSAEIYIRQYLDEKAKEKEAKYAANTAKNALMNMMGNNQVGVCGSHTVKYTKPKARTSFNNKAFAEAHPDLFNQFLEEVPALAPQLRIK